jgi:dehydrogenase/reductase SDR family protein 1
MDFMADSSKDERALSGRVAVVTGASRGIGKGVALALGQAGATVYLTGRSVDRPSGGLPGTLRETAEEVDARGGRGVPVACDHRDDDSVARVFEQVEREAGRLDVLVNNVFAVPDGPLFNTPFWEQPLALWDTMHSIGLRSHYVASVYAAPRMVSQGSGLIANISSFGGGMYALNVAYGVGKAAVDRLSKDMAHDLRPHGVASVSLWPGIVRTERIMQAGDSLPFDQTVTESPEFTGRAVVALASDPQCMDKTGKRLVVAELAEEYGFDDVDGSRPPSLRQQGGG